MSENQTRYNEPKRRGIRVDVTGTEPRHLDIALNKLKRIIKNSKMMVEYQDHLSYKKPSQRKRERRLRSIMRQKRESQLDI